MKLVLYLSTVFLLVFASQSLIGGAPSDRANVLLITVDTLRADRVSCYDSSHLQTPHPLPMLNSTPEHPTRGEVAYVDGF